MNNKLYIGIIIFGLSGFSVNTLLKFDMHDLNGELGLNGTSLCALSFSFASTTKTSISFSEKYTYHYSHTNLILTLKF